MDCALIQTVQIPVANLHHTVLLLLSANLICQSLLPFVYDFTMPGTYPLAARLLGIEIGRMCVLFCQTENACAFTLCLALFLVVRARSCLVLGRGALVRVNSALKSHVHPQGDTKNGK